MFVYCEPVAAERGAPYDDIISLIARDDRVAVAQLVALHPAEPRWRFYYARELQTSGKATEGAVVDVDDDLLELCQRMRESALKNCAIVFCEEEDDEIEPVRSMQSQEFRRMAH